jgi:hypothetical protein
MGGMVARKMMRLRAGGRQRDESEAGTGGGGHLIGDNTDVLFALLR